MRHESRVAAHKIGTIGIDQDEGVGDRLAAARHADAGAVVLQTGVEILHSDRQVAVHALLDSAARTPAEHLGVAEALITVGDVGRSKRILHLSPEHAAGAVDQSVAVLAERIAYPAAQAVILAHPPRHRIGGRSRAERAHAVLRKAVARLGDAADHHIAEIEIVSGVDAQIERILVLGAPGRRSRAIGAPAAESGREGIGACRGANRVAEGTIEIGVEVDGFIPVLGLEAVARADAGVEAGPAGRIGRLGECGRGRGDRGDGEGKLEHWMSP